MKRVKTVHTGFLIFLIWKFFPRLIDILSLEVMSEKTREVPQLADTTYAHTLVIKSTHEYKVHGPYMVPIFHVTLPLK